MILRVDSFSQLNKKILQDFSVKRGLK